MKKIYNIAKRFVMLMAMILTVSSFETLAETEAETAEKYTEWASQSLRRAKGYAKWAEEYAERGLEYAEKAKTYAETEDKAKYAAETAEKKALEVFTHAEKARRYALDAELQYSTLEEDKNNEAIKKDQGFYLFMIKLSLDKITEQEDKAKYEYNMASNKWDEVLAAYRMAEKYIKK